MLVAASSCQYIKQKLYGFLRNILNRLVSGSTWLTLKEGTNIFRVEAVRGVKKLRVTLMHRNSYLGV